MHSFLGQSERSASSVFRCSDETVSSSWSRQKTSVHDVINHDFILSVPRWPFVSFPIKSSRRRNRKLCRRSLYVTLRLFGMLFFFFYIVKVTRAKNTRPVNLFLVHRVSFRFVRFQEFNLTSEDVIFKSFVFWYFIQPKLILTLSVKFKSTRQ